MNLGLIRETGLLELLYNDVNMNYLKYNNITTITDIPSALNQL